MNLNDFLKLSHIWYLTKFSNVDIIDFNEASVLMKKDDFAYSTVGNDIKNYSMISAYKKTKRYVSLERPGPLFEVIKHYIKNDLDFTVFDVGAQYGSLAFWIANYINNFQIDKEIYIFEPGRIKNLTKLNVWLNKRTDCVKFFPYAISNKNGFLKFYVKKSNSEDGHFVKRGNESWFDKIKVKTTTLDSYASSVSGNSIIIIDTQGSEPVVLDGMQKIIDKGLPSLVIEFTPWAIKKMIDPVDFVNHQKFDNFIKFAMWDNKLSKINNVEAFVADVQKSESQWCDILLIHKKMPNIFDLDNLLNYYLVDDVFK